MSKAEWDQLAALPCGDSLPFELIVSSSGAVESARLLPFTGSCNFANELPNPNPLVVPHVSEAYSVVRGMRFAPWIMNGNSSRVLFNMQLPLAPPERFGASRTLPTPSDENHVAITLERHGCEGACPVYSITILGDGTVTYLGRAYVKTRGIQQSHISKDAAHQLLERFRAADFGSALSLYLGAYDAGDNLLKVSIDGRLYQVAEDSGSRVGMPSAILELEQAVDDAAQSRQWVTGG